MKHTKVAIIGAGAVGSTTAYTLMLKNIAAEILLVDINQKRCEGEVFDLADALSFSDTSKIRTANIQQTKNADIIIITAGVPQKSGQTRAELVATNKKIVTSIVENLKPIDPKTIVIVVSNPVDALTFHAQQVAGIEKERVFGTGTFLDSQRLRGIISEQVNIAEQSIHAYIIGEHGDSQFPAWSCAQIAGVPIAEFPGLTQKFLDDTAQKARQKVYEIIECKGATFFGIAACVSAICENIIFDQKRIAPVSVFHESFGICLSMPAVIGCNGVEKIIQMPLDESEQKKLQTSAAKIKETINMA